MADPFSILAGVVGILSSLSALGTQFNTLRRDAAGVNAEMRELTDEVTSLTLVVKMIWSYKDFSQTSRLSTKDHPWLAQTTYQMPRVWLERRCPLWQSTASKKLQFRQQQSHQPIHRVLWSCCPVLLWT